MTLQIGEVVQLGGRTPDKDRAWELIKFYSWKNKEGEYYVPKTWALEAGLLVPYKGFFKDQEIIDSFNKWCDWERLIDIVENKSKIETVRMQIWYPDWQATVNGKPARISQANVAFRAVRIEQSGLHQIIFDYKPRIFTWGLWTSLATSLLVLTLIAGATFTPHTKHGPVK